MSTIGAKLTHVAPGEIDIWLPYDRTLTQQHGFMHGGIVATIADSACGYAAYSLMPAGQAVLSIEFKINLLAPAQGQAFVARGRVMRAPAAPSLCARLTSWPFKTVSSRALPRSWRRSWGCATGRT